MKKIGLLLVGVLFMGFSFAIHAGNYDTRHNPEYKNMGFKATLVNNSVEMSRNSFSLPKGHSFTYWKLMKSQKTNNPTYPENEYLLYNENLGFTSHTDKNPSNGTTRYRICAITQASDGRYRYCSKEVVKINYTKTTDHKESNKDNKQTVETNKKVESSLSSTQKVVVDQMAEEFLKKLEAKHGNDYNKKSVVLENVIKQLNLLSKRRVKMKPMVDYLVEKLEESIDPLEEIKHILDL